MEKYGKEKKDKFLIVYLKLAITVSVLSIIYLFRTYIMYLRENLILYNTLGIVSILIALLILAFTILSIYALVKFKKENFSKSMFIIPIASILASVVGILIGVISGIRLFSGIEISYRTFTFSVDILISLFIISFASYLLYVFKKS